MRVLVTGASGFVGKALTLRLAAEGHEVVAASREEVHALPSEVRTLRMNALGSHTDPLHEACAADAVVHCAARVHVLRDAAADPTRLFREVNVEGSLALARQTRAAGARRFVYLSSIKVLGESTAPGRPFTMASRPAPSDDYATSKLEAERSLAAYCVQSGMELVVIRTPLVYGPGVKANFLRLMQAITRRRPLPLGLVEQNRRSLTGLDNLVDLITVCIGSPTAAGQTFLVSDGEDLSTADLVRRLSHSLGVPPVLLPVPPWLLQLAGVAAGRRKEVQRLCGSLQVDISQTCRILGWSPPTTIDEGLQRTAEHFLRHNSA